MNNAKIKFRILVADDDVVNQSVTKFLLEEVGYEVEIASDGLAALELLKKSDFDLVFMDCLMPVMDGFAATSAIRASSPDVLNPEIPVVALTGLSATDDLIRCRKSGMNNVLIKPLDPQLLRAMASSCLSTNAEMSPFSNPVANGSSGGYVQSDNGRKMTAADLAGSIPESVIDKFLQHVPQTISELETAMAEQNVSTLELIGHRMRGAAELIKASKLSYLAGALEVAAKDKKLSLAIKYAGDFLGELIMLNTEVSESGKQGTRQNPE